MVVLGGFEPPIAKCPFENKSRQIGIFFLRRAIIDRASKKKCRDAGF